jgi:hypothetical protein
VRKYIMPHSGHDVYARFVEEIRLHKGIPVLAVSDKSVRNGFCQSHDIPNLFICGASGFVTSGGANPTETILAIAARTADYVVSQLAIFRHRASRICIFFHISTNRF